MKSLREWKKVERRNIAKLGGMPTPNSGAIAGHKGDGRIGFDWRIEHKGTDKDHYRLTHATLSKLKKDSFSSGGTPLLMVYFRRHNRSFVAVPEYCWSDDTSGLLTMDTPLYMGPYEVPFKASVPEDNEVWVVVPDVMAQMRLSLAKKD